MARQNGTRPLFGIFFTCAILTLAGYFSFAAIQGEYGLFQKVKLEAEKELLQDELAILEEEVALMRNKTQRLSDDFLDIDLLDERARDQLGMVRPDEIVVQ